MKSHEQIKKDLLRQEEIAFIVYEKTGSIIPFISLREQREAFEKEKQGCLSSKSVIISDLFDEDDCGDDDIYDEQKNDCRWSELMEEIYKSLKTRFNKLADGNNGDE